MLKMAERKSADPKNGALSVAEAASESVPFDITEYTTFMELETASSGELMRIKR